MKLRSMAAALLFVWLFAGCAQAPKAAPSATPSASATKQSSAPAAPPSSGVVPTASQSQASTQLAASKTSCQGGEISPDGKTLSMKTPGKTTTTGNATVRQVGCVLSSLAATSQVVDHIFNTKGSDGKQADTWGNYSASWTFSVEQGLAITITSK